MPVTESGGFGVPEEIILATSKIPFLGGDFACPNQSGAYLRVSYGGFKKVEELMNLRGIGERSFLRLRPLVTVGATPKPDARD